MLLIAKFKSCPSKYIGLPFGANPKLKVTWKSVIDKIKSRLSSWKKRHLSFRGRIVLIKAILLSLPLYYMSIFKMPEYVIKSIESIQARFLWGGSDLKRKIHLVAWSKLSQSKLGIKNIKLMNESLLLKWCWRFGMDKSSLWRQVLNAKFNMDGRDWIPKMELNRKVSTVWRDIYANSYNATIIVRCCKVEGW